MAGRLMNHWRVRRNKNRVGLVGLTDGGTENECIHGFVFEYE
jgi:hypothetical protein